LPNWKKSIISAAFPLLRWRGFATRALYLADYLLFIYAPIVLRLRSVTTNRCERGVKNFWFLWHKLRYR